MATTPEDFAQLQERFAKILGRQPTAAETKELMADKDEMGLSYHDPLLVQLMAFKRERIALAEQFRGHQEEFLRQMGELRDHVLRETDKMLTLKKAEVAQASAAQLEAEHKRLVEVHRTVLARVVQEATASGVREKFAETWVREWQTEFTKDWKEAIEPAYTSLRETMNHARMLHWLWLLIAIIASFAAGLSYTLFRWPPVTTSSKSVTQQQMAPVKPIPPTRR
jgi:hypothetical protein